MGRLKSQKNNTRATAFSVVLLSQLLFQQLAPTLAYSDTTPSPSPSVTSVSLSEFDPICKDVLDKAAKKDYQPTAGTTEQQKLQYCKSAKSAMHAADTKGILWKVWAGVSGVCAAACAASFVGVGNQFICMGIAAGAGIADGVLTKQFMSAMMALGGVGGALMVNQMVKPSQPNLTPEEVAAGKKPQTPAQKDVGACMLAGVAAYQVYSNHSGAKKSAKSARTNLASAQNLNDSSGTAVDSGSNTISAGGTAGTTSAATASTSASVGSDSSSDSQSTSAQTTCAAAQSSSNAGLMVQCALASDSTLPKYVATPRFTDDFKKSSGLDFGEFLGKSNHPTQSIMSAAGGTLSSNQSMKLGAALLDMEQKMPSEHTDFMYSSGGGGGGRAPSSDDADLNGMMAAMMQQFAPKTGEEQDPNNGINMVIFANKSQPAAAVAENPSLSIFDRITYRYYFVGQKILTEGL